MLTFAAAIVACSANTHGATAELGANPIRKVVTLLEKMAKKVAAEGEKEAEIFKKYECYCSSSGSDLAKSIADAGSQVTQLQTDIETGESKAAQLQQDLVAHKEDRSGAKTAMQAASAQRDGEHKTFAATSADYNSYISALKNAIPAIQKGMAGAFVQTGRALLTRAVNDATSTTEEDKATVISFLSGGSAERADYSPASGEIVGILQQIQEDFEKSLAEIETAESASVKMYDELMSAKAKQVQMLTNSIEEKSVRLGNLKVEIANMKSSLTDTERGKIEDQKFAADLNSGCASKTAEWDERKKIRAEELAAIHETIQALNDDDVLELFKKTLPSSSLLQLQSTAGQLQQQAANIILGARATSGREHSPQLDFLALALTGKSIDFRKVIEMIDDMVVVLAKEQTDDDGKKEYCETQLDQADDKSKELDKKLTDISASIAELKEMVKTLADEIDALNASIASLDKSVAEATELRKTEHIESMELVRSNTAAKEVLGYAKNRLNKFYQPALHITSPPPTLSAEDGIFSKMGGEAPTSLAQISRHSQQANDAPAPPPATWGDYSKKSEANAGVIAMIDLLVKALDKEITEAETTDKDAQKYYETFMADSAQKRAADLTSIASKQSAKADTEAALVSSSDSKDSAAKEMRATKKYELQLHQECDWLIQHYDLRKEARSAEMDSLKQAKAILAGADYSLAQQHPVGNSAIASRRLRGI